MILLFVFIFATLAGATYLYRELPSHSLRAAQVASDHVVRVMSVTGSAKVKSHDEITWTDLNPDFLLGSRHQVLTGEDTQVELQFLDDKSLLRVPERTFLPLSSPFLVSSKMRRVFYLETTGAPPLSEMVKRHADPMFARVHWVFKGTPEVQREGAEVADKGLALQKESKLLRRIAPKGDISLLVTSFPVYVSVSFLNPEPKRMKIQGYLWNEEMGSEPVWEGETDSYFAGVPISRKGTFVFQAYADNDTYVSLPLRIQAQTLVD